MVLHDPVRRQLFIDEYLKDFNGKRAALACGCPIASAHVRAWEMLQDDGIKTEIDLRIKERMACLSIDGERVLLELSAIAYACSLDYITIQDDGSAYVDLTKVRDNRYLASAISEINTEEYIEGKGENGRTVKKVKVKFWDKKGALELLGKFHKLWTDRTEVGGFDGQPIKLNVMFKKSNGDGRPEGE